MSALGAGALNNLLLQDESALHSVDIEGNGLGDDGLTILAPAFVKNHTLLKVNLNNNCIGVTGT